MAETAAHFATDVDGSPNGQRIWPPYSPTSPPARLRVGHAMFDVREDRSRCVEESVNGYTHGDSRAIILDPGLHPDAARQVLLHELLHACLYVSGAKALEDDEEERVVAALTGPLLGALRDNPALAAFLLTADVC